MELRLLILPGVLLRGLLVHLERAEQPGPGSPMDDQAEIRVRIPHAVSEPAFPLRLRRPGADSEPQSQDPARNKDARFVRCEVTVAQNSAFILPFFSCQASGRPVCCR